MLEQFLDNFLVFLIIILQQFVAKPFPLGLYYHFGIENGVKKHLDPNFSDDNIKLVVGVDGLPLPKSSGSMFWPILCYLRQKNQIVFPIGIYWGYEKPDDNNIFMENFVKKVQNLILNGIMVEVLDGMNNKKVNVKKTIIFDAFCCDIPKSDFSKKIEIWNINDITTKYMVLSADDDLNVSIPIIHFNN